MAGQGRHFLQIPGPSTVPERVLHAISRQVIDHRGPDFAAMALKAIAGLKRVVGTEHHVFIYPGSGTGAWEAALVNVLSPGDKVLMVETGQFATLWKAIADRLGLVVEFIPGDWRSGVDADVVAERLANDKAHEIRAVCCVHNETSTGVLSDVSGLRAVIDDAGHPALLMVDTISSLGSAEYRHDEWGIDVTIGCSQKGLMLPPGLSFNAVSERAFAASANSKMPRSYWRWDEMAGPNARGFFPYTPPTNLLFGLNEAVAMLEEEGLENVFHRHKRHGEATRRAVRAWGLEVLACNQGEESPVLTAVMMPDGKGGDALRETVLTHFNMSLGAGLGKLADRIFRIGHLGDFNDLTLAGTLSGVEMGLGLAGVPHRPGGVTVALDYLRETAK